jgi:hypothetical protein
LATIVLRALPRSLAKGEDFDSDVNAVPEEDAGSGNQGEDEWKHGLLVLTCRNGTTAATASC